MKNLARNKECDEVIASELTIANIPQIEVERVTTQVPYSIIGEFYGWTFKRGWGYWYVDSPKGLPLSVATELHELEEAGNMYGDFIRVSGFFGGIHPKERNCDGFVNSYHIDAQEGLNKFVEYVNKTEQTDKAE
jgi:hypothetical protein